MSKKWVAEKFGLRITESLVEESISELAGRYMILPTGNDVVMTWNGIIAYLSASLDMFF